jgi:hypothetical protein
MSGIKKGLLFSRVDQIGVVVKDVERTARFYEKLLKQELLPPIEFETGNVKLKIVFFNWARCSWNSYRS